MLWFKSHRGQNNIFYRVCIEVGRIRTFPFSSDSAYDSVAYDPVKTRSTESQGEAEEQTNHSASVQTL